MKKYKVNGKVVVADSLREAIVKYRDAQNYSVGQKFRDPKGRIWEVKSVNGDLLTIAVDGKEMSNKLHKEIFAEWAKTWDASDYADSADSVKDYDDEYFSVRYSRDGKDGIYVSRILIKANSEAEARAKFDREMKGYKIASITQGVPEGAESLIRRGISVIDDSTSEEDIRKAREFYGFYDYVSDETVERFLNLLKEHGLDYVKQNTSILQKLTRKNW